MANVVHFFLGEDNELCILQSQHHGCRWPADVRRQGISSHGIDLILQEYSGPSIRPVTQYRQMRLLKIIMRYEHRFNENICFWCLDTRLSQAKLASMGDRVFLQLLIARIHHTTRCDDKNQYTYPPVSQTLVYSGILPPHFKRGRGFISIKDNNQILFDTFSTQRVIVTKQTTKAISASVINSSPL